MYMMICMSMNIFSRVGARLPAQVLLGVASRKYLARMPMHESGFTLGALQLYNLAVDVALILMLLVQILDPLLEDAAVVNCRCTVEEAGLHGLRILGYRVVRDHERL